MNEIIEDLVEQMNDSFKRAEHSVYVSLKYTRTVDVIKNLVDRFIITLSLSVDALVEYLEEKNLIDEKPDTLIERINLIINHFEENANIKEFMNLLLFLRKVSRAEYGTCEEFRRHVTMSVVIEGEKYNIDIDILTEYYHKVKDYVKYISNLVQEIKEDE